MEFFAPIVKADSKFNMRGRNPSLAIAKKDKHARYWPRITKDNIKNTCITIDQNNWVDEDEVE